MLDLREFDFLERQVKPANILQCNKWLKRKEEIASKSTKEGAQTKFLIKVG